MTTASPARKTHWRDNVEAIGAAIVLALLLKAFALEAYKIPTGSMQPTLMGLQAPGLSVSDRIVVDKFSYAVRDPRRFEVAVFRYPLDRSKNFVKRIVGMPGEELRILNGDLWTRPDSRSDWTVLRRPESVMSEHWKRLDDPWAAEVGPLRFEGGALVADGPGVFRLGRRDEAIVDRFFDGYPGFVRERLPQGPDGPLQPPAIRNRFQVGDLRVAGEAVAGADLFELELVLSEGPRTYRFRLPGPAAAADAVPAIEVETNSAAGLPGDAQLVAVPRLAATAPWRLPAGQGVQVEVENLDDRLRLSIAGRPDLLLEVPPVAAQDARVRVRFTGSGALRSPQVWRDVYYTPRGTSQWTIPEGHYVMLGDNTQDSSDSREWELERFAPLEDGEPPLRGNRRKNENPLPMDGPDRAFFVDEWGQRHYLALVDGPARAADVEAPFEPVVPLDPEPAPFVPRTLVTGRALAVFWPINPLGGVVRLKWVH